MLQDAGMPPTQAPVVSVIRPPAGIGGDRLRVTAALVLAAACALTVFTERVPGSWLDFLLGPVPLLLALSAAVTAVLAVRRPWQRPALLVWPGQGRLRVTASPGFGWFVAGEVLLLTGVTLPVVDRELFHGLGVPAGPFRYPLVAIAVVQAVLAAVAILVIVAAVFQGRPRIDLTADGIEIRETLGRRTVPWAALMPGTPARQPSARRMVLTVTRPELVRRRGLVRRALVLELVWLRVQPWFLTDVLRWYVDHPQERAALGTEAGNERLCRALAVR
jgi:hypothetical protein